MARNKKKTQREQTEINTLKDNENGNRKFIKIYIYEEIFVY